MSSFGASVDYTDIEKVLRKTHESDECLIILGRAKHVNVVSLISLPAVWMPLRWTVMTNSRNRTRFGDSSNSQHIFAIKLAAAPLSGGQTDTNTL